MKQGILFIFEGENIETAIFNIINNFTKNEKVKKEKFFFPMKMNIHMLYNEIKNDRDLMILDVVKSKIPFNDHYDMSFFNSYKFPEIYLFFDFDPQHCEGDSVEHVEEMLNVFSEETENGKLYINYPMAEAIRHFKQLPDPNYNNYCIDIDQCSKYKKMVNDLPSIVRLKSLDYNKYKIIINQNIEKIALLNKIAKINTYSIFQKYASQKSILSIQKDFVNRHEVSVISTSFFWLIDYFGEKYFDKILNED